MNNARQIIDSFGRDEIRSRLGISLQSISAAYVDGVMPSSWFGELEVMAFEKGISCPRCAFKFRPASSSNDRSSA